MSGSVRPSASATRSGTTSRQATRSNSSLPFEASTFRMASFVPDSNRGYWESTVARWVAGTFWRTNFYGAVVISHRTRVADFWDDVLSRWRPGVLDDPPSGWRAGLLHEWFRSYSGTNVSLDCYPDPYCGDLRGSELEPKFVFLGLNPGRAHPILQGVDGIWTHRIRVSAYSACFDRSPGHDPVSWKKAHGAPNKYWSSVMAFAKHLGTQSWRGLRRMAHFASHLTPRTTADSECCLRRHCIGG